MPGIFHQSGCCCGGQPCVDCGGSQPYIPQANVSVSGSCDSHCQGADDGDYSWDNFNDAANSCTWRWTGAHGDPPVRNWSIEITYHKDTELWEARVSGTGEGESCYFHSANVSGVSCDPGTGYLTGTFTLPGTDEGSYDCTGCSITITLG